VSDGAIVVLKFGGTSLATVATREAAVSRVRERLGEGRRVVVVVSAMGRRGEPYATDTLLGLLEGFRACPPRERDALAACGEEISAAVFAALLAERGVAAVSLRGFQAGIVTDLRHGEARIREIRPARLRAELERGAVAVVAGFQGITPDGDVTTLGRGGSDTSAVALGVALEAERVEIYTDVDGVMTADPRLVPQAARVGEVTFEESAELAFKGAAVLHPRAAELARETGVTVEIRNTLSPTAGTGLVPGSGREFPRESGGSAISVTSRRDIAQVTVSGADFAAQLAVLERVFGAIAERGVTLDMMSIFPDRIAFTCESGSLARVREALRALPVRVDSDEACAKVTLVGAGIHGVPGVMHRVVRALAAEGIAVRQSVDSNMIIGVLVDAAREADAVRAIHREFFGPVAEGPRR
jgi:aspartate kinase